MPEWAKPRLTNRLGAASARNNSLVAVAESSRDTSRAGISRCRTHAGPVRFRGHRRPGTIHRRPYAWPARRTERPCARWLSPHQFPFRDLPSVHNYYSLRTCQAAKATLYTQGFSSFVASAAALIATGWREPVPGRGPHPPWLSAFSRSTTKLG